MPIEAAERYSPRIDRCPVPSLTIVAAHAAHLETPWPFHPIQSVPRLIVFLHCSCHSLDPFLSHRFPSCSPPRHEGPSRTTLGCSHRLMYFYPFFFLFFFLTFITLHDATIFTPFSLLFFMIFLSFSPFPPPFHRLFF